MFQAGHPGGNSDLTRNVRVIRGERRQANNQTTRNLQTHRRPRRKSAQTIDKQFSSQYYQARPPTDESNAPNNEHSQTDQPTPNFTRSSQATYHRRLKRARPTATIRNKRKKKTNAAKAALGRGRATAANIGIWSWAVPLWLFFQLPFAILSLVFLGTALALEELVTSVLASNGIFSVLGDFVFEAISAIDAVAIYFFSFSITSFHPGNAFMLLNTILIGYAILILLVMYFIYKIAMLKPLSGKSAGLKNGMLLLAIIGYSMPLLNLFPWFMAWTWAVWINPK